MSTRVRELLAEWSDHPTLKQVMLIIERILDFPVTAPLMKFVTGLEVVLEKSQVKMRAMKMIFRKSSFGKVT